MEVEMDVNLSSGGANNAPTWGDGTFSTISTNGALSPAAGSGGGFGAANNNNSFFGGGGGGVGGSGAQHFVEDGPTNYAPLPEAAASSQLNNISY